MKSSRDVMALDELSGRALDGHVTVLRWRGATSNPFQVGCHIAKMAKPASKKPSAGAAKAPSPTETKPAKSGSWSLSVLAAIVVLGLALALVQDPSQLKSRLVELTQRRLAESTNSSAASSSTVDCNDALTHLTDVLPVKGFHVLCIKTTPLDSLLITGFKDGMLPNRTTESALDIMAFRHAVEELFEIKLPEDEIAKKFKQPYAFFTPDGERLETRLSVLADRIVFLFEGGQFIWPGIRIGHKRTIKNLFGKGDVVMETMSMIPLVFSVEEFLRDDEIDIILELSLPHLHQSGVTLNDGHENRPATDWRTSTTYFLPSSAHEVVQNIDRRTQDLVKVPMTHQEFVQVLRYEETQKYDHHHDYFSVQRHQNNPDLLKRIEHGYKNRMITVFWYMSDVAKGGHTIFPRAGGLPPPKSMKDCTVGLKVAPKKRKVIIFYSMLPTGEGDPMSLHGGCPVEDGIKFSGNKWVWNKPRGDIK